MKATHIAATAVVAAAALASAFAFGNFETKATSAAPLRLVERIPFELTEAAVQDWRSEAPSFTSGDIVVLEARDLDLVPSQLADAILLCGSEPVQRLNRATSGVLIGIVPHADDNAVRGELAAGPFHFGTAELPERTTLASTRADLDAALARGFAPLSNEELSSVSVGTQYFTNSNELVIFAADVIERWAPDETDTVRGLRGR
jgi:hypothetical protein